MSDYTSNPYGAPVAPDLGQYPGAAPRVDLPADGEPANAASVNQALTALANHSAWHYAPRSVAGAFASDLLPWRNSMGQVVGKVDHWGMQRGFYAYHEDWPVAMSEFLGTIDGAAGVAQWGSNALAPAYGASNRSAPLPGWVYCIANSTDYNPGSAPGLVRVVSPDVISSRANGQSQLVVTSAPLVANDYAYVARWGRWPFAINVVAELEFRVSYLVRQCGPCIAGWRIPNATDDPDTWTGGIWFQAEEGVDNWHLVSRQPGGSTTSVDTLIAADITPSRVFRLAFIGSEIDHAATTRVVGFIDDAVVGEITTNIPAPSSANIPQITFGIKSKTPAGVIEANALGISELHEYHHIRR